MKLKEEIKEIIECAINKKYTSEEATKWILGVFEPDYVDESIPIDGTNIYGVISSVESDIASCALCIYEEDSPICDSCRDILDIDQYYSARPSKSKKK